MKRELGMNFPPSISAIIGSEAYHQENTGMSAADVLIFENYVLKIRPEGGADTMDTEILRWMHGRLPVPEVVAHEIRDRKDWLLMTRTKGKMLCDPSVMKKPALLLDCMAEALHRLWAVPIIDCPFDQTDCPARAEQAFLSGRFDPSNVEPETFGPDGFESPEALVDWLKSHQPPIDQVFSHGDFCLPNLYTDGRRFSGYIDVGDSGIGDRWMDLALGWRSLKHNSDGHYGKRYPIDPDDLFRAAGVSKDDEKLRYYLLLDELF